MDVLNCNGYFPTLSFGIAPGTAYWLCQRSEANAVVQSWETGVWLLLAQTGQDRESGLRGFERFPVRTLTCCPWTKMSHILHPHVSRDSTVPTKNVWLLHFNDAKTLNIYICFTFVMLCEICAIANVHARSDFFCLRSKTQELYVLRCPVCAANHRL